MSPKKIQQSVQKPSNGSIDKAGKIISQDWIDYQSDEYQNAYNIISEWRWLHTYPLNTFQANLRRKMGSLWLNKKDYIISQRLKRIVSIITKLQRFPQTQLSRLQDIGWIRAIVPDMTAVTLLYQLYRKNNSKLYQLIREKDYIAQSKSDWYRSIHLVFDYKNKLYPQASGLTFEFQIRTFVQHAWATAVETIWTIIWSSLKSNQWPEEWLTYFKYVSVWFSYLEWTKINENFLQFSQQEIIAEIKKMTHDLKVKEIIKWLSVATNEIKKQMKWIHKDSTSFLITLNTKDRLLWIKWFTRDQKEQAIESYKKWEQAALTNPSFVVVLVSIDQIKDLQQAYPSYFWDNELFIENLDKLIEN